MEFFLNLALSYTNKVEKRTLHHSTILVGYWIFGNYKIATVSRPWAMHPSQVLLDTSRHTGEVLTLKGKRKGHLVPV